MLKPPSPASIVTGSPRLMTEASFSGAAAANCVAGAAARGAELMTGTKMRQSGPEQGDHDRVVRFRAPRDRDGRALREAQAGIDRGARTALHADAVTGKGGDCAIEPGGLLERYGSEQGEDDHGVSLGSPVKASVTMAARRPGVTTVAMATRA